MSYREKIIQIVTTHSQGKNAILNPGNVEFLDQVLTDETKRMIEKKYTITNIDFNSPEGTEFLTEMYGNLADIRERLPLFADDIERTRKLHAAGEGLLYKTILQKAEEDRQAFDDAVDIPWVSYNLETEELSAWACTSLHERALYIPFLFCLERRGEWNC